MALPRSIYFIANCVKSSVGNIGFSVVKTTRNVLLDSNQRAIFTSTSVLTDKVKVNSHGALRPLLKVLSESGEDIGVMKMNQLTSLAVEKNMKVHCVDKNALPNPIYKLISKNAKKEKKEDKKNSPRKSKEIIFKPSISDHDFKTKLGNILEWLKKDFDVKVKVEARSADKKHLEVYKALSKQISEDTSVATTINSIQTTEQSVTFTIHPNPVQSNTSVQKPFTLEELKEKVPK